MSLTDETMTAGLDRLNAIFAWWEIPDGGGSSQIADHMKRFQALASNLRGACGDACGTQMATLLNTNEQIARSLRGFLRCRQPQDVIAAEWDVLATVLEQASLQAKAWGELSQKIQDCCAAMARDAAVQVRAQTAGNGGAAQAAKTN